MTTTNGQQNVQAMQRRAPDKVQVIASQLDRLKGQLQAALPKHLTPERVTRVFLTTLRQSPALMRCSPASLFGAMFQASQLGLEIGNGLGHAYLVPYKTEATLVIGYKGLIDLARRSGQISTIRAHEVRKGDKFTYRLGLSEDIVHEPGETRDMGDDGITHVYAVAKLKDGGVQFEVMTRQEIESVRKRSRASKDGPWVTDYAMMARKTVLRRLCKLLPASIEMATAIALDEQADANLSQVFDVDMPAELAADATPEHDQETGEVMEREPGSDDEP